MNSNHTKDPNMQKESPAQYAQRRRDREAEAREALRALLPKEMFDQTIEARNDLNITSKVLVAAKTFVELHQTGQGVVGQPPKAEYSKHLTQKWNRCGSISTPNTTIPFQIPMIDPFMVSANEQLRFLRQVAQRVVHKAEEKVVSDGLVTNEFRDMLRALNGRIILEIQKIEEAG